MMDEFLLDDSLDQESNIGEIKAYIRHLLAEEGPERSYKIERNQTCPCGSGKKYKKCCLNRRPERAREEYLEELLELLKPGQIAGEEAEILGLAQEYVEDYPVDPEAIEVRVYLLNYYGHQEETLEYFTRLARIKKDEYGDELLTNLVPELFLQGNYQKVVELLEMGEDPSKEDTDLRLYYGAALFEIGRKAEAARILQKLAASPRFREDQAYEILLDYLFEIGESTRALEFYYRNFSRIDPEDNTWSNKAELLSFLRGHFNLDDLKNQNDEDDQFKYLVQCLLSPLQHQAEVEGLAEAALAWHLLWGHPEEALALGEKMAAKSEPATLTPEFYYQFARAHHFTGDRQEAVQLLQKISGQLPAEPGQVMIANAPGVKSRLILLYHRLAAGERQEAIELLRSTAGRWLLPLLVDQQLEYLISWNGKVLLQSLKELLLAERERLADLDEQEIYSFYYWAKIHLLKYYLVKLDKFEDNQAQLQEQLLTDEEHQEEPQEVQEGPAQQLYQFMADNFTKLGSAELNQEEISLLEELVAQNPRNPFEQRTVLDGLCWLARPAREISAYVKKIADDLLYDEEVAYMLLAALQSRYAEMNDPLEISEAYSELKGDTFADGMMARVGAFAMLNFSRIIKPAASAQEIASQLNSGRESERLQALEKAADHREELTPLLLDVLQETAAEIERIENQGKAYRSSNFPSILLEALFLLAEFKEEKAFPIFLKIIRTSAGDILYNLMGVILTERGAAILSSVYNGDLSALLEVIADKEVYEFSRVTALNALIALVANGKLTIPELHECFKDLYAGGLEEEKSFIWDELVIGTARFGFADLKEEAEHALQNYTEELKRDYDDFEELIQDFGDYEEEMKNFQGEFSFYREINSAAAEIK